jgi:hypothetical protein
MYTKEADGRCREGLVPTRTFVVGEFVVYGNHDKSIIEEVLGNGLYNVKSYLKKVRYGIEEHYEQNSVVQWHDILKLSSKGNNTNFKKDVSYHISHSNRGIFGLLSMVYGSYAGVDFTPEYQRDYVWTLEDKQKLILSIFSNINVGMILFAKREYLNEDTKMYEVIDGKQRLSTLVEFYEDRFPIDGIYYSQLSWSDRHHFESYQIATGTINEPNEKQKLEAFIATNTSGKVMDESHLQVVKDKLNSLGV